MQTTFIDCLFTDCSNTTESSTHVFQMFLINQSFINTLICTAGLRHSLIHFQILQPVLTLKPICTKKKAGIIAMCKSQKSTQMEYVFCFLFVFVYGLLNQHFDTNVFFKYLPNKLNFFSSSQMNCRTKNSMSKHLIKTLMLFQANPFDIWSL